MRDHNLPAEELAEGLLNWEMRFRSLAQSAVDGIVCSDSHDRIVFWNRAAERMFGYSEEEILQQPVVTIIPEPLRAGHAFGVERFLSSGAASILGKTIEVLGLRRNGEEFPIELSLSSWKGKRDVFFAAIIRDISDRKQAEKDVQEATSRARARTEELESLLQMVAHDLKSPVVTMGGLLRILQRSLETAPKDDRRDRVLDQLIASSQMMESFLTDLLGGLAAEASKPEIAPFDLRDAVGEVLEQLRQAIEEKDIAVEVDLPESLPQLLADERRIKQVLDNLLTNSIRYMGPAEEPMIKVWATEEADRIITRVSDTGTGIPRECQDRVFDRFFRAPGVEVKTGSGLGLFIVKKIIESHGGEVWFESEEGVGTTFSFSLPTTKPDTGPLPVE